MSNGVTKIGRWISDKFIEIAEALRLRSASSVKPAKFVDLAPTDEADQGGVYSAALKFATDSPNVSNIALTGPYGSGKSSIIRSFLKSYNGQALPISLAAFLPEAVDERPPVNKQEIERSILQQLLYGADADKLPLSRFKRIQTPGFWSIFRSLYILTGLLALWHMFDKRAAIFDGSYFKPFDLTNGLDISVAAFALIFLWSAIHHFYVASFGVSLKSVSLKDIQIRPSSEDQDSILNRHLDEIIYFFQSTRYDLVIVEDLDRFDDSDIFVTLREINSLVNGNVGVRRRIRFLYALRDDMFVNTDRTKFFEFIIPVIPIINSSNSIDMVLAQGKRLELDGRLDKQFLREVSRYLSDLRLIHNIFNEYAIYVANLEADGENILDPTKLLAVLIYKNVYPRDFERLHRREGYLAGILERKDELIAAREQSCRSEIADLERDIEAAEKQIPKDLRELRRIYAMALLETLPTNIAGLSLTGQAYVGPTQLSEHKDFEQFVTVQTIYYNTSNGFRYQHNNAAFQGSVDPEASYAERVRRIEHKADTHKKTAHRRIAHLRNEIKSIRTSKFSVLLRSSTQEVEDLFKGLGDGGDLARFLLLEGHLDDSYYQYTSLFHSGRLSPNDNKFLIQIRAFNTPEPIFPIDNPSEVIAGMREDDFSLDYALNVRLVDALLASDEHKERLGRVFAHLSNEFLNQQEFFEAYYATGSHVADFLRQFVDAWRGFVPVALESPSAVLHIASLIEHLPPVLLARERKEHPEIRSFAADNLRDILDLLEGVDPVKLEELQIETKDLAAIDGYPNIARKLYEVGHYRLNDANFDYIFGSILGKEIGPALRKRHYTAVRKSGAEPLLDRVENDFEAYFANVLLVMDDDDVEDIDAILAVMSHDTLDAEEVETFVLRQTKLLPAFEEVPVRFQAMVFRRTRIVPRWSNCLAFIQSENFETEALIAFLNDEVVRAALLDTPIPDTEEALPLRQFLFNAVVLTDEAYRAYVRALPKEFKKFPDAVSANKRQILIDEQRVTFNAENLAALDGEVDLQTAFVAQNIASYLRDPSSFSVDDDFRERLLATDISDDEKRAIIGLMDLSGLPSLPDRAGIVGPILLRTNCTLPSLTTDIVKAIIVNAKPVGTQIRLLNLLHEKLDKNEVREVLGQLPDPYSKIQTGYSRPALRRTNENSELVRWLDERDIISSVGSSLWSTDIIVHLYRS
ncbi:ATP-binding protein [Paracoccus sediminicola]|uniref:YobI family P-loop NTPase n=1 Tax=Paracoccus sediminicola TaxID=3017783 RepID=UPI0022F093DD|nr:ATP-binding protein [Paracoccus sediminicola]WBU58576.1 ATP-binding protein [Paracoccus sediminicola]